MLLLFLYILRMAENNVLKNLNYQIRDKVINTKTQKNQTFLKKKKSLQFNSYITINPKIFLLIMFNLFIFSKCSEKNFEIRKLIFNNEITIIVSRGENQKILSQEWQNRQTPTKITINGTNIETNVIEYTFTSEINEIKMEWNDTEITNCHSMFKDLRNILSIDFRNFDTSKVTSMGYMFSGCYSLVSLDLSRFYTSSVSNMEYI